MNIARMQEGLIHVFYATVSGNAEQLAGEAAKALQATGHEVQVRNLAEVAAKELPAVEVGLFIISTWGDGESPPETRQFFDELESGSMGRLNQLDFAVLALGSSRYPNFCGCGRQLDERLTELGARRLLARVDCDLKYKATFTAWLKQVASELTRR